MLFSEGIERQGERKKHEERRQLREREGEKKEEKGVDSIISAKNERDRDDSI